MQCPEMSSSKGECECHSLSQGAAELDPQDVDKNTKKALALGNALLVCMAVPWAVCVIVYSGAACLLYLWHLVRCFTGPAMHYGVIGTLNTVRGP